MFLQKHIEDVELEPYFKMLAQRPDLLAWTGNKRYRLNSSVVQFPSLTLKHARQVIEV